ncbi:hypothetical protein PV726_49745 [Streptomyces europaeiscabiei]|uniref:hypothetical protein n=1 Tax=Streptomyces europaeiscabiei TaxID=146819 RepID=UPI0029AB847D|nr:hypothetical protein [Streptomyces europaeiscabiei]MDX3698083.1 hypothetical protein [Streptomyces europaeiscabiei]
MASILTSVVAVVGTLLGVALSYVMQRRMSQRGESFAGEHLFLQERVAAYSAFAAALADYQRGSLDRWHRQDESPGSPEAFAARLESHRLRGIAHQELFRVRLLARDPDLIRLAETALERVGVIHRAADEQERHARSSVALQAVTDFVQAAGRQVAP